MLVFSIFANVCVLFVFKYLGFSCQILNAILSVFHAKSIPSLSVVLPIGISFYTFQSISYLVDVYYNPSLVQNDVLKLGLYISFFPQLIAGPIVRYHDINSQIDVREHTVGRFSAGLERFIVGLGKKVLLANSFAEVCDAIYGAGFFSYGALLSWIALLAYTLQIYYDFSGYSDMAIGLARLFGFELLENFNFPYAATSVTDFWRRWHISLTNWFRDYVYIPLGGNREGKAKTIRNRFIVFFVTGLWHGAALNFVLWGLLHGMLMTLERVVGFAKKGRLSTVRAAFGRFYTLFSVALLWLLFRCGTKDAIKILLKMFGVNYTGFTKTFVPFWENKLLRLFALSPSFLCLLVIGVLLAFPWHRELFVCPKGFTESVAFVVVKYIALGALFVLCCARLAAGSYNPFIYFRF